MQDFEALYTQLEQECEQAQHRLRFMLLEHVEHLLNTRQAPPPLPLAGAEQVAAFETLRRNLLDSLGLTQLSRRGGLQARRVGRIVRQGYTVDKIVFHPWPGCPVPAHLYLPDDAPDPLPGILYASGHFVEHGMMYPDSQRCCIALAKLGFAVFAYEAMGQGERGPAWQEFRQRYWPALKNSRRVQAFLDEIGDESAGRRWLAWAWHCLQAEHGQPAPLLVGLSQEGIMVWESMRALDYMATRPEIDATRLGAVGASGGGQNACYTAALDERVRVTVPICYLPSLADQVRLSRGTNWWGGGDLCDQVPRSLVSAEFADIGALILPRPLLFVVGQQDDGFPIQAARAEYCRLAPLYQAFAPDRLRLVEINGPHGISRSMREAAYGWFAAWLQGRGDGASIPEPPVSPEPPDALDWRCLPGQAGTSSRPQLIRLTKQLARECSEQQRRTKENANRAASRLRLLERIRDVLSLQPAEEVAVEKISRANSSGLAGELLFLRVAPEVTITAATICAADTCNRQPLILIVHDGEWREVWQAGWIEMLATQGCRVTVLDVRGTGPGRLRTRRPIDPLPALEEILLHKDDAGEAFVTDFEISSAYLMLGRTLLGERVWDIARFVDWVATGRSAPAAVRCLGVGQAGLVAMFAAALDLRIQRVATWRSPVSFQSLIVEQPAPPLSSFLFGVLRHFDLPDVAASVAPRALMIANPCDGKGGHIPAEEVATIYRSTRAVYEALGVPDRWQTLVGLPADSQLKVCDWLRG